MSAPIRNGIVLVLAIAVLSPALYISLIGVNAAYVPFSTWHRTGADAATAEPEKPAEFRQFWERADERLAGLMLELALIGTMSCLIAGAVVGRFAPNADPAWSALTALLPLVTAIFITRMPWLLLMVLTWPAAGYAGALIVRRRLGASKEVAASEK